MKKIGGERGEAEPLQTSVTRRDLLKGAAAVTTAGFAPAVAGCSSEDDPPPPPPDDQGREIFLHGVASGDPLPDGVILWTRLTLKDNDAQECTYEVAADPGFAGIVASGSATTSADRDFTVKVDVGGLQPATTYYYRFRTSRGTSPIGRTRTAPSGSIDRLRFGMVSCASFAHGYFHVYRAVAGRNDLDAVIHLGDYIYEYETGGYGDVRQYEPGTEIVTLADYRMRHSQYKRDPDLQAVHRQHPFIVVYDDHETANDSYKDGAQNHTPETEGAWTDRRAAALQAYFEWMPIRDSGPDRKIFRKLAYGNLVDLVMLDTRLWARSKQPSADIAGAPPQPDPARTLLGDEQAAWLEQQLSGSTATWKFVGQQVMVGNLIIAPGTIANFDQWHGYPESRTRLINFLRTSAAKDVIVLTGDIHSSWANEIVNDPNDTAEYDPATGRGSVAVEFVTPAVTSPGLEGYEALIEAARPFNPHIRWFDPKLRGYVILDVTPERTQSAWYHFSDITQPTPGTESFASAWSVNAGSTRLNQDSQAAMDKPGAPELAP
jgi:alkaline phosphatase D